MHADHFAVGLGATIRRLDDQESMRHRNRRVSRNDGLRLTPLRLRRAGSEQRLDFVTRFLPIPEEVLNVSRDADVMTHHAGISPQKTNKVVPEFPAGVAFHTLPPTHRQ